MPLSGYYWQVEDLGTRRADALALALGSAADTAAGDQGRRRTCRSHEIERPRRDAAGRGASARSSTPADRSFRAAVAEDHQTVADSVNAYVRELAPALVLLGRVLVAAIFVQITVGLAPLEALRDAVRDVVARRHARLDGAAPREVQPLADEINRLLEAQEKALARARSRATDLAHGLKTPLQVLSADIRALRDKGEGELADEIEKSAAPSAATSSGNWRGRAWRPAPSTAPPSLCRRDGAPHRLGRRAHAARRDAVVRGRRRRTTSPRRSTRATCPKSSAT